MILILTNQAVFVTLSVVTIPPLAQSISILMLNQDDWGPIRCSDTECLVCSTLCAAISGEISILIQTRAESWGRFPVPRICRWESRVTSQSSRMVSTAFRRLLYCFVFCIYICIINEMLIDFCLMPAPFV